MNGQLRQQALAAELSYKPAETLTELSELQDLEPATWWSPAPRVAPR